MRLIERLEQDGCFLFRWRSFLPLLLIPVVLPALNAGVSAEAAMGERLAHLWSYGCMALSLLGLGIRWATVAFVPQGTSGRNTHGQRATVLNTTGLYSVVRNPLYLGNVLALSGVIISLKVWWLVLIVWLAYWLYIERIIAAEERFLSEKFGAAYAEWAKKTPAFIPRMANWRRPAEHFCLRTLLRREYNGLMTVASAYLVSEVLLDLVIGDEPLNQWLHDDGAWITLFSVAVVVFLGLRTLKKNTRLLHVPGR